MNKVRLAVAVVLVLQFLLLRSHKTGSLHWVWVSGVSLLLFVLVNSAMAASIATSRGTGLLAAGVVSCSLVPPAIYLVAEWLQVPSYVINSISQGGLLFILGIVFVSGGWLFAATLVLCERWRFRSRNGR